MPGLGSYYRRCGREPKGLPPVLPFHPPGMGMRRPRDGNAARVGSRAGREGYGTGMNAITKSFTARKRIRKSFGRLPEVAPMPNLIDVQRASYEVFLQAEVTPDRCRRSP